MMTIRAESGSPDLGSSEHLGAARRLCLDLRQTKEAVNQIGPKTRKLDQQHASAPKYVTKGYILGTILCFCTVNIPLTLPLY